MKKEIKSGFIGLKPENLSELSFGAYGLLAMMVNIPECDAVTVRQLHQFSPSESLYKVRNALNELVDKGWILETEDKCYRVNKTKMMFAMTYVSANARTVV